MIDIRVTDELVDRFWDKVDVRGGNDCWEWTGGKDRDGYGLIGLKSPWRTRGAHRVSYVIGNGPIPDGLLVLHSCDNPSCVNPAHLFTGTQLDNMRDMIDKGRVYLRQGARNPNCSLSEDDVLQITDRIKSGETFSNIAKDFSTSRYSIANINTGKNWGWLTGATKESPMLVKKNRKKLSNIDVKFIRHWSKFGHRNIDIAKSFKVSPTTICEVVSGRTWSNA